MSVFVAASVIGAFVLAWSCGAAFAAKPVHRFLSSFGSFSSVQGVAVESATGTVYVYDGGASTVYKFDASGNPVSFTATGTNAISVGFALSDEGEIAVDSSSGPAKGDIYVAHADGSIEIFNAAGEAVGQLTEETGDPWGEACGVAVDTSGAVYVGLYASHINKYVPSSNPVTNADYVSSLEGLSGVCNVAADSTGNAYSVQWQNGPITRYESGQFGSPFPSGSVVDEAGSTLAVDPANDEVYVNERNRISQYGPHGEPFNAPVMSFASTGSGAISGSLGIAVSGFNGDVYVSDGNGVIDIFGPYEVVSVPPVVEEEYVTDVAGTSATIGATVNPEGSATTYHFEYGSSSGYGSSTPETDAGASSTSVSVHVHLQDLPAGSVYHYRLVASNAAGAVDGPDQIFTTQRSGGGFSLLDGRQWELVTPPNKRAAKIIPPEHVAVTQAAADGHAITYVTDAPTESEPEGYSSAVQVLSTRDVGGWSSQDIATPHDSATGTTSGYGNEYRFFSEDLSLALVEPAGSFKPLSPEATENTGYIRNNEECKADAARCYTPLLTSANTLPGAKFGSAVVFTGATADLRHIVLSGRGNEALTSFPGDSGHGLYEWYNGQLRLVSVLPESEGGSPASQAELGNDSYGQDARNAIAADGSRIFWGGASGGLYMRDMAKDETIRIGSGAANFQIANVTGSRVFFSSEGGALEVCEVVEVAAKLTCDTTRLATKIVNAVTGASADGSYVYFVSNEQLAPGAMAGGCEFGAEPRKICDLYVAHKGGSGWETKLVAVLSAGDKGNWAGNAPGYQLTKITAGVSPNGRWFAFMSQRGLTGYDTHDSSSGQADEEVYLYDDATEKLMCASCNPTGGRPTGVPYGTEPAGSGDRVFDETTWLAAALPPWTAYSLGDSLYQPSYLSDEGRLFFNSSDALVPQDVNGTWDVYEYEQAGVGSCSGTDLTFSRQAGGCIDLVSSGDSPEQSAFLDASATGSDVFFLADNRLTSQDVDASYDIYDAHICSTAEPCAPRVAVPPPCSTGDSCKAAPSAQPSVFGAPSSATFAGIGNLRPIHEAAGRRSLSRAQKLQRALSVCRHKTNKRKRTVCERRVRRQYRGKKATRGMR